VIEFRQNRSTYSCRKWTRCILWEKGRPAHHPF